jgi:hypothetical protein
MAAIAKKKPKAKVKRPKKVVAKAKVKKGGSSVSKSTKAKAGKTKPKLAKPKSKAAGSKPKPKGKKKVVKARAGKPTKAKSNSAKKPTAAKKSSGKKKITSKLAKVKKPVKTKTPSKGRPAPLSGKVTKPVQTEKPAKSPQKKSSKPKKAGLSKDVPTVADLSKKKQIVPEKTGALKKTVSPDPVDPGTLEEDLVDGIDDIAEDLTPVDDLEVDLGDDEEMAGVSEELDDDLTEDLAEELGTEKYFRDSDVGIDDDDGMIRGW